MQLLECVPNFSEGRDVTVINKITAAILEISDIEFQVSELNKTAEMQNPKSKIKILHIDRGEAANRTVITFAGEARAVIDAAFRAIKIAGELIDMTKQTGVHPRIGATDVCPLVPLSGISMAETVLLSKKLAQRVGDTLHIPVYLYENSASAPHRKNLAAIRKGEYEGLKEKIKQPEWQPDFFSFTDQSLSLKSGATVIGARDFLVAYNVNLNTKDVTTAKKIAAEIRENYPQSAKPPPTTDNRLKFVKAIGWYIEEYGCAQVSMNLTNVHVTSIHVAFEVCKKIAEKYGVQVTGSELIGLVPEKVLIEAGAFYQGFAYPVSGIGGQSGKKSARSVQRTSLIDVAVKNLGLNALRPFVPEERIIEYLL